MVRIPSPGLVETDCDAERRAIGGFREKFGHDCVGVARAPGRVNLLGEHVDYNDGYVLPAAIDRATYVAFAPAPGERSTLLAIDYDETAAFDLGAVEGGLGTDGLPLPAWARYPAGVAWALKGAGHPVLGLKAAVASAVPRGAGLSSSASVELAFAAAWQSVGGWSLPPMELALLCQRAENQYVGVNCGIMDQAASACGQVDKVLLLDCRTLQYRTLSIPHQISVVIADSGVRHALTASAYNDRRAACDEAVRLLSAHVPEIRALRDVDARTFDRFSAGLPTEVEMRARHVVEEIDRTRRAVAMLEGGDVRGFGTLMNASHVSLRDLYQVSCPELDFLAATAQSLDGCYGARLTGAGFGGCTVNLVEAAKATEFARDLGTAYEVRTQWHADIYVCSPSAGAGVIVPVSLQ